MRFTIKREEFLKGLNIASRAISSKNAKAVLENFKLELNEKGLFITGTDENISIKNSRFSGDFKEYDLTLSSIVGLEGYVTRIVGRFIDKDKLMESAARYGKSPYGAHLKAVAEGKVKY